jgi:phage terminase large subunit-like protein
MAMATGTGITEEVRPTEPGQKVFDMKRSLRLTMARMAAENKDILLWGKALFPEKFHLPYCRELHEYFVDIRGDEFTSTKAPRNHAKTAIKCFLIPLFQALYEPETFRHYLNVQATDAKALSLNTSIRDELAGNELLRSLVGNQVGARWTDQQFVLKNGVVFTAKSAGQSIRGINYNQERPSYLIIDDLYNEEDINNPESTEKKNDWFWSTLYPARAQSRRCAVHVQGTAINQHDLLTKLEKDKTVKSRTFKAITDWDRKTVLWPELNTFDSLMVDLGRMSSYIFMREMQNEPRDEASAIIKRAWLYPVGGQSWEYEPQELEKKLADPDSGMFVSAVSLGNDPSIGKKTENDATGTALVIETQYRDGTGHEYWIEGLWNDRLSLDERLQQLKRIAKSRPPQRAITRVLIEAIAGFNDYADEVIRRTDLPVVRVTWVQDKITNLENKSHYFQNGKVHLNAQLDSVLKDQVIEQLTNNHSKHDDMRDGILLCLDDATGVWNFVK